MPQYQFKAIDASGKVVNGVSGASDQASLSGILQGQGLFLMESSEVLDAAPAVAAPTPGEAQPSWSFPTWERGVSTKTLAFMTTQFGIMVRTSLPVLESLNLLAAQAVEPRLKAAMKHIVKGVSEGMSLSTAFARHPDIFDDVYISMLAAGEMGGELDQMLDRLASYQVFRVKLTQNIRSALAYPLVVVFVTCVVVGFLLLFVLPTFMDIFVQLGVPLPLPTRILIGSSMFFRQYWWVLSLAVVLFAAGFMQWLKNPQNARRAARFQLSLWVVGPLTQNIVMTRTLRTMGSLFASGVSILKCLELARSASGNVVYADFMDEVAVEVREGKQMGESFAKSRLIPPMVASMIATGERTGKLPEVISLVADFYESETESSIKQLFVIIEPVFILGLGLLVAGVAVSVLLPMFSLSGAME